MQENPYKRQDNWTKIIYKLVVDGCSSINSRYLVIIDSKSVIYWV